ncbi:MAG: sulfite exporter TauE/SafE family protein [Myxococcota bacterium]
MLAWIPLMGVAAGALTTVAGLGGGMLLLLALSMIVDPAVALAATAPALLVGNAHRAWIYRAQIDREVATRFALGAFPGSLLGGLVAAAVPGFVLRYVMVALVALAVLRASGRMRWSPPRALMTPVALGIGALTATGGGAAVLVAPLMSAAGLTAERYVATTATAAVAMHVGRLAAYGAGGLLSTQVLQLGALLTVTILLGNVVGQWLRRRMHAGLSARVELGVMLVCCGLALAGVQR